MYWLGSIGLLAGALLCQAQDVTDDKIKQLNGAAVNTNEQVETTDNGVQANTSYSLRAGPRGFNLLEDTTVRKKMIHFDRERAPERVVHALGHGAHGTFESYGDWSNITMACWLQSGAVSEVFTRFSVVVASMGGSENGRDTHGFATKIYSQCGNQDLVGNHVPSFFINDGANFPDLIHAVKYEPDKGFPTGGSAHTTAYDFFNQHPEGAFQLMTVLSDLGIPRDVRHMSGNGVHTFRFINAQGQSQLFKWYWIPTLGHRSLVYPEVTTLQGKNNNFQRIDLYNNIAAGNFPEWEFAVQLFPDDGTYMYGDYDLTIPTQIVPFEVVPPTKLGKLTLNRNFDNFFAEPESVSFAPSNVVDGVSFVPDPLLQWRLMSYDDTATHRHNSPNGYLLPINKPIAPLNNNYRDGYMQPQIFQGASASTPNTIGGVVEPGSNATLGYGPLNGFTAAAGGSGNTAVVAGRYQNVYDWFGQARTFWHTLDSYAQQHTVDAYRFELGNVADPAVAQSYIDQTLNQIDNCLARRIAWGIGLALPSAVPNTDTNTTVTYPSLYPLTSGMEPNKPLTGLSIVVLANDTLLTAADHAALLSTFSSQNVTLTVLAPRLGELATTVNATASYITASSVFYDAVVVGSSTTNATAAGGEVTLDDMAATFIREAYSHGKAIGALSGDGPAVLAALGFPDNETLGVYSGNVGDVAQGLLAALAGPVRFPARFATDDVQRICGV